MKLLMLAYRAWTMRASQIKIIGSDLRSSLVSLWLNRRVQLNIKNFVCCIIFLISIATINADETSSTQGFSKQDLVNFLRPLLGEKINTKDFDIVIEKMPTESVPENVSLKEAIVDDVVIPSQQRSFQVSLKLKSGEKISCSGKIEWLANIPILLRPIGPGDIINVSDVGYHSYPVDQLTAMVVMDGNDIVGKSSAHTIIKPGLPVERSLLKNPTIIKRGDMVDVVYRSQCLIVSAKAQATQDLACGDTGTFETQHDNIKQTKKISAKVVGPSTAEILHGFA
jgi:flagella basal body P-ring formation protein FlgA